MLILRGTDKHGSGEWHSSRANGKAHNGIDIAAPANAKIMAPVSGTVSKLGWPSNNPKKQHLRYVEVMDYFGNRHRCMYVAPTIEKGERVEKGMTEIGVSQDLTKIYSGMINHVHYEVIDATGHYRNPMTWLT
jgi:murein DD-endopeptidase MepM/ murein hydrolase activator NlpD